MSSSAFSSDNRSTFRKVFQLYVNVRIETAVGMSLDRVADHILRLGKGAVIPEVDIKQAYRVVPVHPDDHCLLRVCWHGQALWVWCSYVAFIQLRWYLQH